MSVLKNQNAALLAITEEAYCARMQADGTLSAHKRKRSESIASNASASDSSPRSTSAETTPESATPPPSAAKRPKPNTPPPSSPPITPTPNSFSSPAPSTSTSTSTSVSVSGTNILLSNKKLKSKIANLQNTIKQLRESNNAKDQAATSRAGTIKGLNNTLAKVKTDFAWNLLAAQERTALLEAKLAAQGRNLNADFQRRWDEREMRLKAQSEERESRIRRDAEARWKEKEERVKEEAAKKAVDVREFKLAQENSWLRETEFRLVKENRRLQGLYEEALKDKEKLECELGEAKEREAREDRYAGCSELEGQLEASKEELSALTAAYLKADEERLRYLQLLGESERVASASKDTISTIQTQHTTTIASLRSELEASRKLVAALEDEKEAVEDQLKDSLSKQLAGLKTQNALEHQKSKLATELASLKASRTVQEPDPTQVLNAEISRLTDLWDASEKKCLTLSRDFEALQKTLRLLSQDKTALTAQLADLERLKSERERLHDENDRLVDEKVCMRESLADLQGKYDVALGEKDDLQGQLRTAQTQNADLTATHGILKTEIVLLKPRMEEYYNKGLEEKERKYKREYARQIEDCEAQIEALRQEKALSEEMRDMFRDKVEQHEKRMEVLKFELGEARQKIDELSRASSGTTPTMTNTPSASSRRQQGTTTTNKGEMIRSDAFGWTLSDDERD